jgi:hypothetical protein
MAPFRAYTRDAAIRPNKMAFAFRIIPAFDSCPGSSLEKLLPHYRFPEFNSARIAGSIL